MVAGDLVNTAARLQSVAHAGTVLVGEATERAAAKAIAFEAVTEQSLKGKQSPVKAYRAVRVVAEVGGAGRSEMLEAPFVGRLEELRLLKDLFHSTGREKRTRLVSVIGPAGIGKSRLAWEFLKYIDGLVDLIWWHAGRSPAYGSGLSFWALGEMVRERCGLRETDDQDTTRDKVHAAVEEWVTDADEQRWIESALLSLLGVGDALPGGRDEMFAAWRTFFERIAERGTVVMLFEDLHWADPGLLDFIDHIMEWARSLPIYVVTASRSIR
jgi:predicted ATPase